MVEEKLGIVLEKKETRSNWLRRPLTDAQLKYASLDVEYLIYLYEDQVSELNNCTKIEWHNQDIERLIKNTFDPNSVNNEIPRTLPLSQENEFLEAARSSETSDEFDALIFGAEQSDSVETTTKNTDADSELPI